MKTLLAPILMLLGSAAFAQDQSANLPRYEFFGGYSVNGDYVKNRAVLLALDQKVSPFFSYRLSMDYDPTFLVRPVYRDPVLDSEGRLVLSQPTPSARARQDHARLTMGIVWKFH